MQRSAISNRQILAVLILYIVGSTIIISPAKVAIRDSWISSILAFVMALPLALLYSRILKMEGEDFFDTQTEVLGPVVGKLFIAIFAWYGFHVGSIILRQYTEFIQIDSFPHQEQYIFTVPIIILSIWCIRSGIQSLGFFSLLAAPVFAGLLLFNSAFSIGTWTVDNLLPVFYDGIQPVLSGAIQLLVLPYMEVSGLLAMCKPAVDINRMTRTMIGGFAIGMVIVTLIFARNMMVLGDTLVEKYYFPSQEVVKLASIGDFIYGLQILSALVIMLGYYVKSTVFLFTATLGVSKLLGMDDYRKLAAPMGFLYMIMSMSVVKNMPDLLDWVAKCFTIYWVLPGIVMPAILLLVGTIKHRRQQQKETADKAVPPRGQAG